MTRYLYAELSILLASRLLNLTKAYPDNALQRQRENNPADSNAAEWFANHTERIEELVREYLPSGAGFDSGTKLDLESSHPDKLVFTTSYHHMNQTGMYVGWTDHTVTVTPSLSCRYTLRISGRNKGEIKEYMHEVFSNALDTDLLPVMQWEATEKRTNCSLVSFWRDSCTQFWNIHHNGAVISPDFTNYIDARAWAVDHFAEVK